MSKTLFTTMIAFGIYYILSAIIEIIVICVSNLNRKALGGIGIFLSITSCILWRILIPEQNDIFQIGIICSAINFLLSAVNIALAIFTCDSR